MNSERGDDRGWQVGKSLKQNLKYILTNEVMCDVTFKFRQQDGPEQKLSAHRLILSAQSPVFEAMFNGNFRESNGDIEIVDAVKSSFGQMLNYIYYEEVHLSGDNVLQILNLARKYILNGLLNECSKFLCATITVDNVCVILNQCIHFGEDDLVQKCLNFAWANVAQVLKKASFYSISHPALLKFLACDRNEMLTECDIVKACLKWATKNGSQDGSALSPRAVLGDCVYQIRFATMTAQEFTKYMSDSSVLTSDEKCMFMFLLSSCDKTYLRRLAKLGFNMTSSLIVKLDLGVREAATVRRSHEPRQQQFGYQTQYIPEKQALDQQLRIIATESLTMTHLGVFGKSSATDVRISINVKKIMSKHAYHNPEEEQRATCSITTNDHRDPGVMFQAPITGGIRLERGNEYNCRFVLESGDLTQIRLSDDLARSTNDIVKEGPRIAHSRQGHVSQIIFKRE